MTFPASNLKFISKSQEMVAKKRRKTPTESATKQPEPVTKRANTQEAHNNYFLLTLLPNANPPSHLHPNNLSYTDKETSKRDKEQGKVALSTIRTKEDPEKSKVVNESDSSIPDPSHQTVTSTPPAIALVIDFSFPKPSSQVTTPPINTEATNITHNSPKITLYHSPSTSLRVAKLSNICMKKETDHLMLWKLKADEDAMEKEVKDRVKDHKRKQDSDDDEDDDVDEGLLAGSNQGKSTKRRRHDSEPESRHSKHSFDDVSKQDEGHVSNLEDTDNAHIPKVPSSNGSADEQERRSSTKLIGRLKRNFDYDINAAYGTHTLVVQYKANYPTNIVALDREAVQIPM
ncbi:hypothetical protein Tco_1176511 [Tanacetum coccineum]